jgi:hypothetical protein
MHLRTMLSTVCLLVVSASAHARERYEGLAYAPQGSTLLYSETHWLYEQAGVQEHLVLYRCPDGSPFARKRLRSQPGAQAPDFDFLDARDGYREGVRTAAGGAREVFVQARGDARLDARPLPTAPGAVIDAGFDAFVRGQWAALSSGGALSVPFLVPSRFEYWRFRIADARDDTFNGEPVRWLRMRLDAWYGFAAPNIALAYEPDGRRLVAFQGIGTIRDRQGRHLDVRIEFPSSRRQAMVTAEDMAAALTRPLVSQCPGGVL